MLWILPFSEVIKQTKVYFSPPTVVCGPGCLYLSLKPPLFPPAENEGKRAVNLVDNPSNVRLNAGHRVTNGPTGALCLTLLLLV